MNFANIGTETPVDELVARYFPGQEHQTIVEELFEDETNVLLAGILMELGGQAGSNEVLAPEDLATVANEKWTDGDAEPVSFDGDLTPGDEEIAAQLQVTNNLTALAIKSVGVTSHAGDIDGDSKDENIERYHYEYQERPDGQWHRHEGLSGVLPLGDLARPAVLMRGAFLGPVAGFRVRIENRTDEPGNTAFTVDEDEIGARIHARTVEVE